MKKLVLYLESKDAVFQGGLLLICLYVPHAGNLFMKMEHINMTLSGYTVLNWVYGVALAGAIEFLILLFIINGYRATGKFYAVVSFFLNVFYYDYWFVALRDPTDVNIKSMVISLFICLTHSLSVWQLSELFYKRMQEEKEREKSEFWCNECEAGPFANKRAMDGHISKTHRLRRREEILVQPTVEEIKKV